MTLLYTIIALIAVSVGSVLLSSLLLLLRKKQLEIVSQYLLYLAGGVLLGSATLALIPEAAENITLSEILAWLTVGIVFFFILEKVILWRVCNDTNCERQNHAAAPMILAGDAIHNAIDGVLIAGAFLTSPELGFFVTLSVMLHEIPQELCDFGILIKSGYSRRKALIWNMLSGCSALVMGIVAFFVLKQVEAIVPYVLVVAAAGFIYISLADLIPEMHKETKPAKSIIQLALILLGIGIILLNHEH
jgi:Predicted divalent heavy-metal cations transporter